MVYVTQAVSIIINYTFLATKETVNIEDLVDDFATYYLAGEPCFTQSYYNHYHEALFIKRPTSLLINA